MLNANEQQKQRNLPCRPKTFRDDYVSMYVFMYVVCVSRTVLGHNKTKCE